MLFLVMLGGIAQDFELVYWWNGGMEEWNWTAVKDMLFRGIQLIKILFPGEIVNVRKTCAVHGHLGLLIWFRQRIVKEKRKSRDWMCLTQCHQVIFTRNYGKLLLFIASNYALMTFRRRWGSLLPYLNEDTAAQYTTEGRDKTIIETFTLMTDIFHIIQFCIV